MKVLDLQCVEQHFFEGWFASEEDFVEQFSRRAIQCPVCGIADVVKRLSAPRLSLGAARHAPGNEVNADTPSRDSSMAAQRLWLQACRHILAHTSDLGSGFSDAAREMHFGEAPRRAIRGQATEQQVESLLDEGIEVLPFLVPKSLLGLRH
jgi:hypothetical protein